MPKETPRHINEETWEEAYKSMKEDRKRWMMAALDLRVAIHQFGGDIPELKEASKNFFVDKEDREKVKEIVVNDPLMYPDTYWDDPNLDDSHPQDPTSTSDPNYMG